jgi:putative transposase
MPHQTLRSEALASLVDASADFAQDDLMSLARRHLKTLVEISLDLELTAYRGRGRHVRSPERKSYRNGYYTRDLVTGLGLLEALRVPRCREKGFVPRLFARYQRRHKQVDQLMRTLFFLGVSTRGVSEAMEVLLGFEPSAQAVSETLAELDAQVKAFHRRPLSDDYVYLFLDGVTMTIKELPQAVKRLVLVAYGITADGHRVLLDYKIVKSESAREWERFLTDLYERGVKGKPLRLITTDGGQGVRAALPLVYGEVPHQLCWAHKLRNVSGHLKKEQQSPCLRQAAKIYAAKHRRAARQAWEEWKARWEAEAPKAVECLGRDLEALLCFLDCPREHHRRIRTTNYIERLFREVRRRTRLMGAFANRASCDRMLYGTLTRINRNWSRKALPGFTHQG